MSNYTIGLSGLRANNNALDVISNNIANASTVGYKAGEYIFEDQFYKAVNPLDPARAGQGTAKQNIRRLFNMGSVQESANTLDMAITGSMGMFRLASGVDPAEIYYSRNGQFAVSKEVDVSNPKRSYIVNENGMYLTGYASTDGKQLTDSWTNRLTMPPTELEPVTTKSSTVSVNLDARRNAFLSTANVPFDPQNPTTFNHRVSQTVYSRDDNGNPHTMTLYYRRVDDRNMTVEWDGSNLRFEPSVTADPKASLKEQGFESQGDKVYSVLTNDTSRNLEYLTAANRKTTVTADVDNLTQFNVQVSSDIQQFARIVRNGFDTNRVVATAPVGGSATVTANEGLTLTRGDTVSFFNPATQTNVGAVTTADTSVTISDASNTAIAVNQNVWAKDATTGAFRNLNATVTARDGTTLTLSAPVTLGVNDTLVFYNPITYNVPMQDGTKVAMMGDVLKADASSTDRQKFVAVTTQYEVYGALNDVFFNAGNNNFYSDEAINPAVLGTYKPIATLDFWGGKNIDAIRFDPITGEPAFQTKVTLTGLVTTPGNTSESRDIPLIFDLDLTRSKNYATAFAVEESTQDGRPVSLLNSVSIDNEGKIVGTYGDGRNYIAGQLVLVNFAATNGLVPSGGNAFQSSYLSGDEVHPNVVVGRPGQKGLGGIRAGAVEGSNVDLANELVKLLIQQRMYSANSQSIRAFDDTLTTTIRMTGG